MKHEYESTQAVKARRSTNRVALPHPIVWDGRGSDVLPPTQFVGMELGPEGPGMPCFDVTVRLHFRGCILHGHFLPARPSRRPLGLRVTALHETGVFALLGAHFSGGGVTQVDVIECVRLKGENHD